MRSSIDFQKSLSTSLLDCSWLAKNNYTRINKQQLRVDPKFLIKTNKKEESIDIYIYTLRQKLGVDSIKYQLT